MTWLWPFFCGNYYLCDNYRRKARRKQADKKLSSISFEVYLSHMMIYRVLEKLKINHMFGLNAISYGVTAVLTLTGAIAFSYIAKSGTREIYYMYERES